MSGEALFEEVAGYGVEDSIEEVNGLGGGVAAGNFERLVMTMGAGVLGVLKELGYGSAEEVAVDYGHALEAPIL